MAEASTRDLALRLAFIDTVSAIGGGAGRSVDALSAATYVAGIAALGIAAGHDGSRISQEAIAQAKKLVLDSLEATWPQVLEDAPKGGSPAT